MIKYVELTAPDASAFRQAKILSIECQEGDQIKEGDTLFRVQSGAHEINLPATKTGRVVELIVALHENITLSTALLLLETEVDGSTASTPIASEDDVVQTTPPGNIAAEVALTVVEAPHSVTPSIKTMNSEPKEVKQTKTTSPKREQVANKKHEQQSLDLIGGDLFESQDSPEQHADINEVVLTQTVAVATTESNNQPQPSQIMPSNTIIEVAVPDIGADSAKVIEILVNVGDAVSAEDPLITLESDKASMDVPSPYDGVVKAISVSVDQDVSEGILILELESQAAEQSSSTDDDSEAQKDDDSEAQKIQSETPEPAVSATGEPTHDDAPSSIVEVRIPDIGGDSAKVIEILVNIGDTVDIEDALMTLESDKASMDVPSSSAGVIQSIDVSVDQDVNEGTLVVTVLSSSNNDEGVNAAPQAAVATPSAPQTTAASVPPQATPQKTSSPAPAPTNASDKSHASPSIRRFARELGVELSQVSGSGRKSRVTHDDVKGFVKSALNNPGQTAQAPASGSGIPPIPAQDFTKFGEVDVQPLNKIKRLTAANLHRSWLNVPHVTHSDESNINDLESFRKQLNAQYAKQKRDIKLSPLAFIVKAVVNGLQQYPQFNSSLEPGGENLIYKKYFNIGIAVETPNGLVVPVIKDADKKSVAEIAKEMGDLAAKARDKKLTMNDMSGACMTISSLGGIGGTGFTPIVNAPEVAILGVSRSKMQPVWNGSEFIPGMILPLSLSYDHRVIDGAEAARFTRHIAAVLEDVRLLTV